MRACKAVENGPVFGDPGRLHETSVEGCSMDPCGGKSFST